MHTKSQTHGITVLRNRKESANQNFNFDFFCLQKFSARIFSPRIVDSDSEKLIVAPRTFPHKSTAPAKICGTITLRQNMSNKNKPAKYLENVVL